MPQRDHSNGKKETTLPLDPFVRAVAEKAADPRRKTEPNTYNTPVWHDRRRNIVTSLFPKKQSLHMRQTTMSVTKIALDALEVEVSSIPGPPAPPKLLETCGRRPYWLVNAPKLTAVPLLPFPSQATRLAIPRNEQRTLRRTRSLARRMIPSVVWTMIL